MADKKTTGFFAYPGLPYSRAETIEEAIKIINNTQNVDISSWRSTSINGKYIINEICKCIEEEDIFLCDITGLNPNVLFELGFAIAKKRRIWIIYYPHISENDRDLEKFNLITVGHAKYSNVDDIVKSFTKDAPHNDLESNLFKDSIESFKTSKLNNIQNIFYLKSKLNTEDGVKLSLRISKSTIPNNTDNPDEVQMQTLPYYIQSITESFAVIAHFISQDHKDCKYHNAKLSFVSGIAHGLGKHFLMLAQEPYKSPIDYKDYLKVYKTPTQCKEFADKWLIDIENIHKSIEKSIKDYSKEIKGNEELSNVYIGDPVAENESRDLLDYFIPTAVYNEAIKASHSIIVGKKGSGKSAIYFKIENDFAGDSRNHVCSIRPVGYELEGVLRMIHKSMGLAEKGYLIESFWKFLLFSELAKSYYERLSIKPLYSHSKAETEFIDTANKHKDIVLQDFSIRLEHAVDKLQSINEKDSSANQRIRISELLHKTTLNLLISQLAKVLEGKKTIALLIDNLDTAWKKENDLSELCDLLRGLISVSKRIHLEFEKMSPNKNKCPEMPVLIFLRSDIFSQVFENTRERDKLPHLNISWDDKSSLIRVLNERFWINHKITPEMVWGRYFCNIVSGIPTKDFILSTIIPRPRDLLWLSKFAISLAVSRGHKLVEERDIIDAHKQYSQNAFESLLSELIPQYDKAESFLYEFVGANHIINRDFIVNKIKSCGIPEDKTQEIIEMLCDSAFLGLETSCDKYEFIYNEDDKKKILVMAQKVSTELRDGKSRYKINKPFRSFLETNDKMP